MQIETQREMNIKTLKNETKFRPKYVHPHLRLHGTKLYQ